MTSKSEKDRTKQIQDKCQTVLNELLRDEDNKYCVDCDTKGPRWASWNLGVFLCIRCAGIHRNLGVHISKVKSVNLDSWTPEQVVSLQQMGNSRARAVYEANLPDNFRRPQNDSSLESFVRAKYEHKKYIAREWVPPPLPKVNWEKEIDEEIERQKKKKNKFSDNKSKITLNVKQNNIEIPQLPKPKSAQTTNSNLSSAVAGSGSNNSSTNLSKSTSAISPKQTHKSNVDLLKLDSTTQSSSLDKHNVDDTFSSFLSGPATKEVEKKATTSDKTEEENFFNQPAPTEKEKTQLTKDSILALYGNQPVNNLFQPPTFPNQFSNQFVPTMTSGIVQSQMASYPNFNATPFNNGFNQFQSNSGALSNQQFPLGVGGSATNFQNFNFNHQPQTQQTANFTVMPNATQLFSNDNNFFQQQSATNAQQYFVGGTVQQITPNTQNMTGLLQQPVGAFTPAAGVTGRVQPPVASQNIVPNPFLTNQTSNLQQQFGNLSLNNVQQTPKVSTNVWQ